MDMIYHLFVLTICNVSRNKIHQKSRIFALFFKKNQVRKVYATVLKNKNEEHFHTYKNHFQQIYSKLSMDLVPYIHHQRRLFSLPNDIFNKNEEVEKTLKKPSKYFYVEGQGI